MVNAALIFWFLTCSACLFCITISFVKCIGLVCLYFSFCFFKADSLVCAAMSLSGRPEAVISATSLPCSFNTKMLFSTFFTAVVTDHYAYYLLAALLQVLAFALPWDAPMLSLNGRRAIAPLVVSGESFLTQEFVMLQPV